MAPPLPAALRRSMMLVTCLLLSAGSGCGSPRPSCSALTCTGCCSAEGVCESGNTSSACGRAGATCMSCSVVSRCEVGNCVFVEGGSTGGATAGGASGGLAGGAAGGSSGGASGGLAGGTAGGSSGGAAGGLAGGTAGGSSGGAAGGLAGGTAGGSSGGAAGGSTGDTFWVRNATQVLRQRPAGTAPVAVSATGVPCKDFTVSDDGSLVVLIYNQQPETVVVAPAAGGTEQLIYTALLNEALSAPIISPDNQWVAFTKGSTGSDVMVVSVAPPNLPIRATPSRPQVSGLGPSRYAFSPDSRSLAVTGSLAVSGRLDLRVFNLATRVETTLIPASEVVTGGGVREIGWSNTGTLLARASLLATPSQTHQILTCGVAGPCSPLPGDPGNGVTTVGGMAVAPDGTFLVYSGNQRTGFVDLYRISTLGGLSTRLVQSPTQTARIGNSSLVISRDGQRVAFVADFSNPMSFFDVYVVPAAGATVAQPLVVATVSQAIDSLEFSPTATALAFRLRTASSGPYGAFRTVNLTTPGQSPVLLQASPVLDLRWSR